MRFDGEISQFLVDVSVRGCVWLFVCVFVVVVVVVGLFVQ